MPDPMFPFCLSSMNFMEEHSTHCSYHSPPLRFLVISIDLEVGLVSLPSLVSFDSFGQFSASPSTSACPSCLCLGDAWGYLPCLLSLSSDLTNSMT